MRRLNSICDPTAPTVRVVVLGGRSVGKSALVVRFLTKRFIGEYVSGKEITYLQEVCFAGNKVTAEICDALIKKESIDSVRKLSTNTEAYFIVYNVCCRISFEYACRLAQEVKTNHRNVNKDTDVPVLLVGNKSDLDHLREVKRSEGEDFTKSMTFCYFVETSAAESYSQVERAFRILFQLVRKQLQLSPTPSVSLCRQNRKHSFSQVAQLIREHVRKQSISSGNKANSLERGMSLSRSNFVTFDKNNNSAPNDSYKRRTRRSGVCTLQQSNALQGNNQKPKVLSKCHSLGALTEYRNGNTAKVNAFNSHVENRVHHKRCHTIDGDMSEAYEGEKLRNKNSKSPAVMKMSLSSDDPTEYSDISTTEEDAFLPESNPVSLLNYRLDQPNFQMIQRPKTLFKNPDAPHRSPKASINKKGLQLSIHSDGEIEEKRVVDCGKIPPNSAPIISSAGSKFRYYPNAGHMENQNNFKQPWMPSTNSTVPVSPLLEHGPRTPRVKSPKEEKQSPSHNIFKNFFKGVSYSSLKGFSGSSQSLQSQISPASSETSLSTFPEYTRNVLSSIDEHMTPEEEEEHLEGKEDIYFHASSSSLSSIVSNDTSVFDTNSLCSVPSSPGVKKQIDIKPRRASFRKAVGELIRKRKKTHANECFKHSKEHILV